MWAEPGTKHSCSEIDGDSCTYREIRETTLYAREYREYTERQQVCVCVCVWRHRKERFAQRKLAATREPEREDVDSVHRIATERTDECN